MAAAVVGERWLGPGADLGRVRNRHGGDQRPRIGMQRPGIEIVAIRHWAAAPSPARCRYAGTGPRRTRADSGPHALGRARRGAASRAPGSGARCLTALDESSSADARRSVPPSSSDRARPADPRGQTGAAQRQRERRRRREQPKPCRHVAPCGFDLASMPPRTGPDRTTSPSGRPRVAATSWRMAARMPTGVDVPARLLRIDLRRALDHCSAKLIRPSNATSCLRMR